MRAFWFAAGTVAGVYLTAKARRAAEALTVEGAHDRLTGWFAGARVLREEVLAGMAEKETELRDRLVEAPGTALARGRAEQAAIGRGPDRDAPTLAPSDDRYPCDRHPDDPRPGARHSGARHPGARHPGARTPDRRTKDHS